jgi:nitrile hydratase
MDGIHDLGGKEGFGPIPIDPDDNPFHHDWEERMWAIARSGALGGDITIDWFRHSIECMVPSDYLAFRYFQKWCTTYLMLLVDNGTFTMDEVQSGKTDRSAAPPAPLSLDDALAVNRAANYSFEVECDAAPLFKLGDTIMTRRHMDSDHTRLPAYARGACGEIIAHHGAHLLPDKGVHGIHEGEHLYTVVFTAPELWGEAADPRDSVALELWESYLVPA